MSKICRFTIVSGIYSSEGLLEEYLGGIHRSEFADPDIAEAKLRQTEERIQDTINSLKKKVRKIIDERLNNMISGVVYKIDEDDADMFAYNYFVEIYLDDSKAEWACPDYECEIDQLEYSIAKDLCDLIQEAEDMFNVSNVKSVENILKEALEEVGLSPERYLKDLWLQHGDVSKYFGDCY